MLADYAADQSRRRSERQAAIERAKTHLTPKSAEYPRRVRYFPAPQAFNLSSSFEETIKFLMQFRQWSSSTRRARSFYVDLRRVTQISPAGALLLAAEFHRWKLIFNRKLRARDAGEWDPEVRRLLGDMGFFELLAVEQAALPARGLDTSGIIFLPFACGRDTNGQPFVDLRDLIEAAVGRLKQRLILYQGVTEAITNVLHHAYAKSNKLSRWWMSASIDTLQSKLTVMVLDHGQGIPRTLPRKGVAEKIQEFLNVTSLATFSDDGRMIEAAVTLGRSAVQQPNRGHGLQRDVQAVIKTFNGAARLRILSNRGRYSFERDFTGATHVETSTTGQSLDGTFVEWTFQLPQRVLPFNEH